MQVGMQYIGGDTDTQVGTQTHKWAHMQMDMQTHRWICRYTGRHANTDLGMQTCDWAHKHRWEWRHIDRHRDAGGHATDRQVAHDPYVPRTLASGAARPLPLFLCFPVVLG